jgi:hypothetical protein
VSRAGGLLALALLLAGCAGTAPREDDGAAATTTAESATTTAATSSAATTSATATTAAGQQIVVEYVGGQVRGDSGRIDVALGTPVTITITSDMADEAHLHGYDLEADLLPAQPAELRFDATIPGVFELELHDAGRLLLTLQIG